MIGGLGNLIQLEKLTYKGMQKNYGRRAKVRASEMFVSSSIRKACQVLVEKSWS